DISFQYQQPIARFDSQVNGQVENQLTVAGDGTVLAKDIKAETLEVGQLFSTALHTEETQPLRWRKAEIQTILNSLRPVKIPDNNTSSFNAAFRLEKISDLLTSSDGKAIKVLDVVAIITQAVKENRTGIKKLVQQINEQKARIETLEQQNLQVEITSLRTRLDALEQQNLQVEIISLRTRFEELDALEEENLETEITGLKTEIDALEDQNIEEKITELKTIIDTLDTLTEITGLKTEIDALEQKQKEIASMGTRIDALERKHLQLEITRLKTRFQELEPPKKGGT
ncbi:hypothetical protein, partial [Crocosphaera sp.]|uniref:hypothetical protein n=1 Tax=Crocosphaera sp. TaxID=2729996 RepID=UPI00262F9EA4